MGSKRTQGDSMTQSAPSKGNGKLRVIDADDFAAELEASNHLLIGYWGEWILTGFNLPMTRERFLFTHNDCYNTFQKAMYELVSLGVVRFDQCRQQYETVE
jgi:hypothetical protein